MKPRTNDKPLARLVKKKKKEVTNKQQEKNKREKITTDTTHKGRLDLLIYNQDYIIIIGIHAGSVCLSTRIINADITSILSAIGSRNFPNVVT